MIRRTQIAASLILACASLAAQGQADQLQPRATGLSGKPFFLKTTWYIGGEGNWDYLALDPNALQLFVAHGNKVQVVDVSSGAMAGEVSGFKDAHAIALDDHGAFAFVTDGAANQLRIVDRGLYEIVASVPTGPSPRAVVYEPLTRLVFVVCTQPVGDSYLPHTAKSNATPRQIAVSPNDSSPKSVITVIDLDTRTQVANLLLPGKLGFAQTDGRGEIYVGMVDSNRIAHFDAQSLIADLHPPPPPKAISTTPAAPTKSPLGQTPAAAGKTPTPALVNVIDWSGSRPAPGSAANATPDNRLHSFHLGPACPDPKGLALDGNHMRLFTACDNQKMEVINAGTGEVVSTLTIGLGADAIGYDPLHGFIFTANGGGAGSVTVIRQDVNDTYAVVQELPTQQRARTLAVNPISGDVYLVTNLVGIDAHQSGTSGSADTLPTFQAEAVKGSFQVLVIGN